MKFKIVFTRLFCGYLTIGLLFGIPCMFLNFMGKIPIMFNGNPYYGFWGILIPVVYIPMISGLSALVNAAIYSIGNKVANRFQKKHNCSIAQD